MGTVVVNSANDDDDNVDDVDDEDADDDDDDDVYVPRSAAFSDAIALFLRALRATCSSYW